MAEPFDDATEPTISIQDYLQEVEDQELEADLILGGDEGKDCTYSNGYMKRQAIFSCLTCNPDGMAGVCTACSLSCHDGHEIVELWTKRNFRCDCGNSKFGEVFCKIFPNKDVENIGNSYNHNFKGLYCTCNRPYPDPDVEEQVEMIQCCVCEDWFHEEHLGLESIPEIPRDEEGEPLYEDFICGACSEICSFLRLYPSDILASGIKCGDSIKISKKEITPKDSASGSGISKIANLTACHDSPDRDPATSYVKSDSVLDMDVLKEEIHGVKSPDGCGGPSAECVLGVTLTHDVDSLVLERKPMFLSKNWREALCRCGKCSSSYSQKNISFLVDKEDSIAEYEKIGKQKREEKLQQQEGAELSLLDNLGHVEKIEILNGIAEMKDEMRAFLESCDASKPITTEDIHQVFENLAKKRRRSSD